MMKCTMCVIMIPKVIVAPDRVGNWASSILPLVNDNVPSSQIEHAGVSSMERDNDGATPAHFAAARG